MLDWQTLCTEIRRILPAEESPAALHSLTPIRIEHDLILLESPTDSQKTIFLDRYGPAVEKALKNLGMDHIQIRFQVRFPDKPVIDDRTASIHARSSSFSAPLNPAFTFSSFIEDSCNSLCLQVGKQTAAFKDTPYNPFLVIGGDGSGKTHLLQAIANEVMISSPQRRACYLSASEFSTSLEMCIKSGMPESLRTSILRTDLFLLDDIEKLAHHRKAQDEFIVIFNELYDYGKHIVLSSDSLPKEISGLDERLKSRLGWGLIAEIGTPSSALKKQILHNACEAEGIRLSEEIISYLLDHPDAGILFLERIVVRLAARLSLSQETPDLNLVVKLLNEEETSGRKDICETVRSAVVKYFGISEEDLDSSCKSRDVVFARQTAMYLIRRLSDASFAAIAQRFGGKDHSTVVRACKRIGDLQDRDIQVKEIIDKLMKMTQI